jgi:hypothetical protein
VPRCNSRCQPHQGLVAGVPAGEYWHCYRPALGAAGIERGPAQFFKRYNAKAPERGGCRKATYGDNYLRRFVGYLLVGDTSEQSLHFLYGLGANGKSVFCEVLSGCSATTPWRSRRIC